MSVYAFSDVNAVITHQSYGQYSINGTGIGNITVAQSNEQVVNEVAADGTVMTSKLKNFIGTAAVSCQQNSPLNVWLNGLYNYLKTAPTGQFAGANMLVKSNATNEQIYAEGLTPSKLPDKVYEAQGQMAVWNFLSTKIEIVTI